MDSYSERFRAWVAKRKPEVRARILRLNPSLEQGRMIRGYRSHRRSTNVATGNLGKGYFIKKYGREAWAALPRCCIIHDGHRKAIRYEDEVDRIWMMPADHPIRQARREKGQWVIHAR